MQDLALINTQDSQTLLIEASRMLVPWWSLDNKDILRLQTEKVTKNYLDSFYLFPLHEISINSNCDDIPKFINERFQNILAAAIHSGLTVALVISGKNGKNKVFLGFKNALNSDNDPKLFQSIVNGILPGRKIVFQDSTTISSLANAYRYGGMVTGVPILKSDDEKQRFNLSSVARSLYGREYLLAIISKPVSERDKLNSFGELIQIRDRLHTLAKQTVGEENGGGKSSSETSGKSSSETRGNSKTKGIALGLLWSKTRTENTSETFSTGKTETFSTQHSRSFSVEQQNGYAMALEEIADHYIQRIIQGFRSGFWETSITFATKDKLTSDILAGTFAAELSKPSDKILPPPRIYIDCLEDKTLFIPKNSSSNVIFPKFLASYLTTEELSIISSSPTESVTGYEIQKMPSLALTDFVSNSGMILGHIADHGNPIDGSYLYLSKQDLNKHLFVCGLTGSGKTTTVKHILKNLVTEEEIPFLVIESAKRDYRQLLADDVFKGNLNIFTIGDATVSPIRFNPFYIQEGVHPLKHIDYLKALFNASFSLYGPMPSIVEKCLHAIYIKKGWDLTLGIHPNFVDKNDYYDESRYQLDEHYYCFPTLTDLKNEIDSYIKTELDYKGELRDNIRTAIIVRLESLCVGTKGLMFNTYDFFPMHKLLSKNTIFEMENLSDDDDKAFFVGLMLVLMSEVRQRDNPAINPGTRKKGFQHFLVIEEAHRLLKNIATERTTEMMGNPKGKAVEVFCNVISEMRSMGQGVAVVEQIPSKIAPDVIKNSNTKIVHRIVSKDDQSLLAGSLSISDEDALYLNRLETGHALCYKEGMGRPIECVVSNHVKSHAISDEKVYKIMKELTTLHPLHDFKAYELFNLLKDDGKTIVIQFFNTFCTYYIEGLDVLINLFSKNVKKLLLKNNISLNPSDKEIIDYLVLSIMKLITKGFYSKNRKLPDRLRENLFMVFTNHNKESYQNLLKALSGYWDVTNPKLFIFDVIEQLAIKFINDKQSNFDFKTISYVVNSYFLFPDAILINTISQEILEKIGGKK